jgi:hypothetical protein
MMIIEIVLAVSFGMFVGFVLDSIRDYYKFKREVRHYLELE